MNSPDFYELVLRTFAPILSERQFDRNEQLHPAGKDCPYLYFVKSGLLRTHYLIEGREVTAHFALPGYSITAPDSFITGRPTKYFLTAVVPSEAYALNRDTLEEFLAEHPQYEVLARRFTQALYLELLSRVENLVFLSARERYAKLLEEQPEVLALAPLLQIATYLGMTPETLSRVRAAGLS